MHKEIIKIILKQRGKFILSLIMMFFSSFSGGIGIALFIPIIQKFAGLEAKNNKIILYIEECLNFLNIEVTLKSMLGALIMFTVLRSIFIFIQNKILHWMLMEYEISTRNNLYYAFLKTKWSYILKVKQENIQNALVQEIRGVSNVILLLSKSLANTINIFFYIIIAVSLLGMQSIVLIISIGLIITTVISRFFKISKKLGIIHVELNNEIQGIITEALYGLKYIKASDIQEDFFSRFNKNVYNVAVISHKFYIFKQFIANLTEPVIIISASAMIFLFNIFSISADVVSLGITVIIFTRIYSFLMMVLTDLQECSKNIPSIKLCTDIINESEKEYETVGSIPYNKLQKEILFQDVYFSFIEKQDILSKVNFFIEYGKTTALVGKSGSGKTTIVDMVMGLLLPQDGKIFIDGVEIRDLNLNMYRHHIGYVPQEPFIINDTIEANLRIGLKDVKAKDIENVVKMAHVDEFSDLMPEGLNTFVGDKGTRLSGGQRQRIALARALLRKPDLLILDEATSALDNISEYYVQKAIEGLKEKLTIIIIAHRLNTVRNSNIIYEVDNGKVFSVNYNEYIKKINSTLLTESQNITK